MTNRETILRALAEELKHMDIEKPSIRIIRFTLKLDRLGVPRSIEHGVDHHRELL